MVNYDNDVTIATPSVDINRVQILQRRSDVIHALEKYYNYKFGGAMGDSRIVRSKLASLFWELQETIERKFDNYEKMKEVITSSESKFKDVLVVWERINKMLGEIKLTRIDNKKEYDQTNIEEENSIQGL